MTKLEFIERLPEKLQSKIFQKVMGIAELLKLKKTDREAGVYQAKGMKENLKKHRDLKNALDTSERVGFEKGVEKTAISLFKEGMDIPFISKITNITEDQLLEIFRRAGLV